MTIGLTGTPPGSRGAAPWERFGATTQTATIAHRWVGPSATTDPDEPVHPDNHAAAGSHTEGGLSVADLIAKVGVPVADRPRHHHAAPDTETVEREARRRAIRRVRRLRVAEPGGLRRRASRPRCHPPQVAARGGCRRRADHGAAQGARSAAAGPPARRPQSRAGRGRDRGRRAATTQASPTRRHAGLRPPGGRHRRGGGAGHDRRGVSVEHVEEPPSSTPSARWTSGRATSSTRTRSTATKTS